MAWLQNHCQHAAARAGLGWEDELIECQLGHTVGNDVQRAYDKSRRLPDRRRMMQAWAGYLDGLRDCLDGGDDGGNTAG